ncbi:MAG: molybdate ABC transporter substrate-binding protein [Gemmatimonadales bacterium]|nr:MAG: molybdate ABC transporter substrate-binding protein [Gemmatimonadales bacterium]
MIRRLARWALVGFALGTLGCADEGGEERHSPTAPLLVLAASDLQTAFEELVPAWERQTGDRVELVLGSTGNLAAQIRHGAPADLFFSANERFLDDLIEAGTIDPGTRTPYAVGRLALAVPGGAALPDPLSELTGARFQIITIANPEHAPYGMAALEVLRSLGIAETVSDRLVPGESIAHTLQFLSTGNADIGIVALSLLQGAGGRSLEFRVIDSALHTPLLQVAGMAVGSLHPDRARHFLEFVVSAEGQAILGRHGFEPPAAGGP